MRISDWSSDVCSSDLLIVQVLDIQFAAADHHLVAGQQRQRELPALQVLDQQDHPAVALADVADQLGRGVAGDPGSDLGLDHGAVELGSASWRARVWQYV